MAGNEVSWVEGTDVLGGQGVFYLYRRGGWKEGVKSPIVYL